MAINTSTIVFALLLLQTCTINILAFRRPQTPVFRQQVHRLSAESRSEEEVRNSVREIGKVYDDADAADNAVELGQELLSSLKGRRSYVSIVVERFMQSVDDWQMTSRAKEAAEGRDQADASTPAAPRERVVVLGSGWGAHSLLKSLDARRYEVLVISPRNYFLFTPMLAASAVGTVEFRSICEPIRNANALADYLEAAAVSVNTTSKSISCRSVKCAVI